MGLCPINRLLGEEADFSEVFDSSDANECWALGVSRGRTSPDVSRCIVDSGKRMKREGYKSVAWQVSNTPRRDRDVAIWVNVDSWRRDQNLLNVHILMIQGIFTVDFWG